MIRFADTSFIFALYIRQQNTREASEYMKSQTSPPTISPLIAFEFRQSLRLQAWRAKNDKPTGLPLLQGSDALNAFEADLALGYFDIAAPSLVNILEEAERVSRARTIAGGHRTMDILHVATALVLEAKVFLTFDANQRELAAAEGLRVAL